MDKATVVMVNHINTSYMYIEVCLIDIYEIRYITDVYKCHLMHDYLTSTCRPEG